MPARLIWSPQAETDLFKLYVDIGLEQPDAAERYYQRIEHKAELLTTQPRMGVRRRDIRAAVRMLVEAPLSSSMRLLRTRTKALLTSSKSSAL